MFARPALFISIFQAVLLLGSVEARIWLLERDGRAIFARRFGQEQPAVLKELAAACKGGICEALADEAIAPLLAAQPECSQQDMADKIIDASHQFDAATRVKMIAAAVKYRQAEKNTPLDFSTNPPTHLNSVYCQKTPKNSQLNDLVQAQDPANDLNLFFDPANGSTVTRGSQPNTLPLGTNVLVLGDQVRLVPRHTKNGTDSTTDDDGSDGNGGDNKGGNDKKHGCHKHHGNHKHNGTSTDDGGNMKNGDKMHNGDPKNGNGNMGNCSSQNPMNGGGNMNDTQPDNGNNNTTDIGNFGSCSIPQIQFGAGFDGRRETSFEPVDKVSYNHGSAQNIDIITQFMCDQLVNTCKADSTALSTCARAKTAADGAPAKTGKQADAFNAVFGKVTDFASVTPLDNQGNPVSKRSVMDRAQADY